MAKKGTRKKTAAQKSLGGNAAKRRLKNEPKTAKAAKAPEPPKELGAKAKTIWRRIAPELHRAGLLTKVDEQALYLYCCAWQDYYDTAADIKKNGATGQTEKGYEYLRPAYLFRKDAIATIHKIGAKLGLTPTDRVGLDVTGGDTSGSSADPMDDLPAKD